MSPSGRAFDHGRYTMFGHEADSRGITFEQCSTDPEIMLTRQLEHLSWLRRHVPQGAEMGPPTQGWPVSPENLWPMCDGPREFGACDAVEA